MNDSDIPPLRAVPLKVTYLYDVPGWALHNLGLVIREALAPHGIDVQCVSSADWHDKPRESDVLYLSYSGLMRPFAYRDWAPVILTTVHDPCEVSHFEDRSDWRRFPMLPVDFRPFDRVSAISAQLIEVLQAEYGMRAFRTPTWPLNGATLLSRAAPATRHGPVVAISSTNVGEFFTMRNVLRRLRSIGEYTRDQHGALSLRQLGGLAIVRRRKNIGMLRAIGERLGGSRRVRCDFRFGATSPVPRDAYEEQMLGSDVYVCTSNMEGGPLPVLEAVFSGLAVISTPVGQVQDWVRHGENGWICSSVDEFAAALDGYAADPALLLRHRRRSVEIASAAVFPVREWLEFLSGVPA